MADYSAQERLVRGLGGPGWSLNPWSTGGTMMGAPPWRPGPDMSGTMMGAPPAPVPAGTGTNFGNLPSPGQYNTAMPQVNSVPAPGQYGGGTPSYGGGSLSGIASPGRDIASLDKVYNQLKGMVPAGNNSTAGAGMSTGTNFGGSSGTGGSIPGWNGPPPTSQYVGYKPLNQAELNYMSPANYPNNVIGGGGSTGSGRGW